MGQVTPLERTVNVQVAAHARLPTEFGEFRIVGFGGAPDGREHVALVMGDVDGEADVLARLHSECLTGDAFGSLRCDCRAQLHAGLHAIADEGRGVLLYLRQEGRGIGRVVGDLGSARPVYRGGDESVLKRGGVGVPLRFSRQAYPRHDRAEKSCSPWSWRGR